MEIRFYCDIDGWTEFFINKVLKRVSNAASKVLIESTADGEVLMRAKVEKSGMKVCGCEERTWILKYGYVGEDRDNAQIAFVLYDIMLRKDKRHPNPAYRANTVFVKQEFIDGGMMVTFPMDGYLTVFRDITDEEAKQEAKKYIPPSGWYDSEIRDRLRL